MKQRHNKFRLIDYKIKTLAGGLLGAALNYTIRDRLVFNSDNHTVVNKQN